MMIFCARATRGIRRPSPGLMARLGVPVSGRVRKLRTVEAQSAPISEERTSEPGGIICRFARRPQWGQHGRHSMREKQASLEGSMRMDDCGTMPVVEGTALLIGMVPLREVLLPLSRALGLSFPRFENTWSWFRRPSQCVQSNKM
jgi:hypothetical protein